MTAVYARSQTLAALAQTYPAEQAMYQDLVNGTIGRAVRLGQEFVSFASLEQAVDRLISETGCFPGYSDPP